MCIKYVFRFILLYCVVNSTCKSSAWVVVVYVILSWWGSRVHYRLLGIDTFHGHVLRCFWRFFGLFWSRSRFFKGWREKYRSRSFGRVVQQPFLGIYVGLLHCDSKETRHYILVKTWNKKRIMLEAIMLSFSFDYHVRKLWNVQPTYGQPVSFASWRHVRCMSM